MIPAGPGPAGIYAKLNALDLLTYFSVIYFLFTLLGLTALALVLSLNALVQTLRTGLPYVTTPSWAIRWLVDHLSLTDSDVVYEIGCGDARVIAALAEKHPGLHCVGIEIQWWPYLLARWRTRRLRNVRIIRRNAFQHDISSATVVYGFYITAFVAKLSEYLKQSLRPGARIISFGFALPGWRVSTTIAPPAGKGSRLLFYEK